MTDDLVGRLDRLATHLEALGDDGAATVFEAAARIEALEAALDTAKQLVADMPFTNRDGRLVVWRKQMLAALTPEAPHAD